MSNTVSLRNAKTICRVFHVLSDQTRLKLVLSVKGGELNVTQLCKKLRLPQPTVSHHLSLLRIHCVNDAQFARALEAVKAVLG